MSTQNRLPAPYGLLIDRNNTVRFSFEGKTVNGFSGDSITSAILGNDVKILSRSFKYHRPRGALSVAGHDANALLQLPERPNVDGDRVLAEDGMKVTGQNYFGSLESDKASILGLFSRFMPVGFYYRAFFKPYGAWMKWEPIIRAMAGLGKVDLKTKHDYHDKKFLHPDITIIGGGLAGLSAALEAAPSGQEILLIDENQRLGGSLNFTGDAQRAEKLTSDLAAFDNVTIMTGTIATSWFNESYISAFKGKRFYKIRTKATIVATGSAEQPLIFRNNDLPGVMLASAADRLVHLYGVRPGKKISMITVNDHGLKTALRLKQAGLDIVAVIDTRDSADPVTLSALKSVSVQHYAKHGPVEAMAASGNKGVTGLAFAPITGKGETDQARALVVKCDTVLMAGGYFPLAHLICHHGPRLRFNTDINMFTIPDLPESLLPAGSVANCFDDAAVAQSGQAMAAKAVSLAGGAIENARDWPLLTGAEGINSSWPIFPHKDGKEFVDYDEDQQVKDIRNAVADGYSHVELMKRYTTTGMGPSQGRQSQTAAMHLVAEATNQSPADIGVTTSRPPFLPEPVGVLGGRCFEPERFTPMHHNHKERGAQMMAAGVWWRPAYYGPVAKRDECIRNEVDAIRNGAGLIDVSTLGGLEVRGPDAGEFLNRVYTMAYKKLAVGKTRYLLMTDDTGVVIDDGVEGRLSDDVYYVTATTGGVDRVYRKMLWWNAQWRLDVDIANVTGAWGGINLSGPKSREILEKLTDIDLSPEGFPYLGIREGKVGGVTCRLMRIGFVGELGYEIHAPYGACESLWDALLNAGKDVDITPVGIEAMRILRLEKGHVIVSQDTDGLTTPAELDMFWALANKKPFYVGKRALEIRHAREQDRKLVGYSLSNEEKRVPLESHLTYSDKGKLMGRVTSSAWSPTLECAIGLAYVHPDEAKPGTFFKIRLTNGAMVDARVVAMPFYDADNARQAL